MYLPADYRGKSGISGYHVVILVAVAVCFADDRRSFNVFIEPFDALLVGDEVAGTFDIALGTVAVVKILGSVETLIAVACYLAASLLKSCLGIVGRDKHESYEYPG